MTCPNCLGDSYVIDSRDMPAGVRRRRRCKGCKQKFSTYEQVAIPTGPKGGGDLILNDRAQTYDLRISARVIMGEIRLSVVGPPQLVLDDPEYGEED